MSKIIEAFWKQYQVWPELCPKRNLSDAGHVYKHSCLECIIDGRILCDPRTRITDKSQGDKEIPPLPDPAKDKRRPRTGKWRQCPVCQTWFYAPRWRILKGEGHFCSHKCAAMVTGCPAGVSLAEYAEFKKSRSREDYAVSSSLRSEF